jgi:hypothetical protein
VRKLFLPLLAVAALAAPTAAQADHNPSPVINPLPTSVTDEASANTFAQAYVLRNAARIADVDLRSSRSRSRVTVSDVASACLQHPVVASRFGCIVRFNIAVSEERNRTYSRGHGHNPLPTPVRTRSLGCLAALRISGGPSVTPSVTVAFADCVQRRSIR